MIVSQQPAAIHTAFNPVIVKLAQAAAQPIATIKIAFGNHDVLPSNFITKSREFFNGSASIDLSALIKRQFTNEVTVIDNVITDKSLALDYSVFDNAGVLLFKATALNAVSQLGVTPSLVSKRGSFLTEFNKLKRYENYELNVSCLAFETGSTYIIENGESVAITNQTHFSVGVEGSVDISNSEVDYLTDNEGEVITTNAGIPITTNSSGDSIQKYIEVENECTPINPFYIRWINQSGGRDYWMFARQIINTNVENIETYNQVITEQGNSATQLLSVSGVEKIQVSSIQLTPNEYKYLSKIPFSPKIEWFNEELQQWFIIIIDKGELSNDTSAALKSVEFIFKLPEMQLQF